MLKHCERCRNVMQSQSTKFQTETVRPSMYCVFAFFDVHYSSRYHKPCDNVRIIKMDIIRYVIHKISD